MQDIPCKKRHCSRCGYGSWFDLLLHYALLIEADKDKVKYLEKKVFEPESMEKEVVMLKQKLNACRVSQEELDDK